MHSASRDKKPLNDKVNQAFLLVSVKEASGGALAIISLSTISYLSPTSSTFTLDKIDQTIILISMDIVSHKLINKTDGVHLTSHCKKTTWTSPSAQTKSKVTRSSHSGRLAFL